MLSTTTKKKKLPAYKNDITDMLKLRFAIKIVANRVDELTLDFARQRTFDPTVKGYSRNNVMLIETESKNPYFRTFKFRCKRNGLEVLWSDEIRIDKMHISDARIKEVCKSEGIGYKFLDKKGRKTCA